MFVPRSRTPAVHPDDETQPKHGSLGVRTPKQDSQLRSPFTVTLVSRQTVKCCYDGGMAGNSGAAYAPARATHSRQPRKWLLAVALVLVGTAAGVITWIRSPLPTPKLLGAVQITHDGLAKSGVLSAGGALYVNESAGGKRVIRKSAIDGTERSVLPIPVQDARAYDIKPDGSSILVGISGTTADQLATFSPAEGQVSPLQTGGRWASWSPDGKHIVYVSGSSLYIANPDGTAARELTSVDGSVFFPRFSPDGQHIRFSIGNTIQNSSTSSIWEIGADGKALHRLFAGWHNPPNECCGSWTADGHYYIFQVTQTRPANVTHLWALGEAVAGLRRKPIHAPVQLTTGSTTFGSARTDASVEGRIWALGVQPSGEFVAYNSKSGAFAPILPGVSGTDLDFSRDGKWVAYVAIPEGTLWRSRIDGSDRVRLSSPSVQAALPRWSPDGKQVAYMAVESGKTWKTYVVSSDGSGSHQLLAGERNQVDANWSPDSQKIVFGDEWSSANPTLQILDLQTRQVTSIPGSEGLFSPRWSPDGRYVAALSTDFTRLMLFDFTTQKWSPWLVEPAGAVSYPSWSADSHYLYFEDLVTGEDSIRRIKVGQNSSEFVFAIRNLARYPGPLGLWNGRAADGSQVFVRDKSTQEVYRLDADLP